MISWTPRAVRVSHIKEHVVLQLKFKDSDSDQKKTKQLRVWSHIFQADVKQLPHKRWFLFLFLFSSPLFAWKQRSTGLTISLSKHPHPKIYIYIFCNTPSVNHCIFKSTSEPKQLESDHMSVSEMKENARRFHRLQTHSALSKALRHQTFTTISFKNPSCENSCYANEVVTGCLVTRRSWNCCVRSLRTFRAWIRVRSLRLKWVFFYVWRSLKKKVCVATCPHFVFLLLLSLVSTGAPQYIWIW